MCLNDLKIVVCQPHHGHYFPSLQVLDVYTGITRGLEVKVSFDHLLRRKLVLDNKSQTVTVHNPSRTWKDANSTYSKLRMPPFAVAGVHECPFPPTPPPCCWCCCCCWPVAGSSKNPREFPFKKRSIGSKNGQADGRKNENVAGGFVWTLLQ